MKRAIFVLCGLFLSGQAAFGHEVRPGYLEIRETAAENFAILWKMPTRNGMRLPLEPRLPENCTEIGTRFGYEAPGAVIERWTVGCEGGIVGHEVAIDGLVVTLTDVLLRFEPLEGGVQTARLRPNKASYLVPAEPSLTEVARTYLTLGVEHILGGIDHLLFVLALLMLVSGKRRVIATVTAFTVAHSITLALATLGFVHVPPAPVEAVIALSILFLATEIVHGRRGRPGLTERAPWVVAFTFGLLHGFGFAGALSEVGLPDSAIPVALLLFNVGVEVGQLLFVFAVLILALVWKKLPLATPRWAWAVPTYAIGTLAAFWTVERILSFWAP